jgi:hypothetical protein
MCSGNVQDRYFLWRSTKLQIPYNSSRSSESCFRLSALIWAAPLLKFISSNVQHQWLFLELGLWIKRITLFTSRPTCKQSAYENIRAVKQKLNVLFMVMHNEDVFDLHGSPATHWNVRGRDVLMVGTESFVWAEDWRRKCWGSTQYVYRNCVVCRSRLTCTHLNTLGCWNPSVCSVLCT